MPLSSSSRLRPLIPASSLLTLLLTNGLPPATPGQYAYTVTKLGSTEATTLYASTQNLFQADGFYKITLAADGTIAAVSNNQTLLLEGYGYAAADLNASYDRANSTAADLYWDRTKVEKFEGDSLVGAGYGDYRVNSSTEYYVVTKTQYSDGTEITEITKGDINSVAADDVVVIGYTSKNAAGNVDNVASYVYVMKLVDNGSNPEITTGTVEFKVQFVDQYGVVKSDVLDLGVQKKSTTGTFTFDLQTVLAHQGWQGDFTWDATTVALVGQLNSTGAETYTVNAGETTTVIFTVIK